MKEGLSPSKPPSLPRTFPKSTRPDMAKICFAMFGRVLLGKVFCFWGGIFIWCGYRTRFVGRARLEDIPIRVSYPTALRLPIGCDSRTIQKIRTSRQAKNFPTRPPPSKRRNKTSLESWWGSCGEVRGGCGRFGGRRNTLRKGVPSPSKVFLPYLLQDSPRTKRSRR